MTTGKGKIENRGGMNQTISCGKNSRRRIVFVLFLVISLGLAGCGSASGENSAKIGREQLALGNYKEALVAFDQAISHDEACGEYYCLAGTACLYSGDYADAQSYFLRASQLDSQSMEAWRGLGIAYMNQDHYREAIDAFDEAVSHTGMWVSELDYDILEYRAEAEYRAGESSDALVTYQALIDLGYHKADNYFRHGVVCLSMYDVEAAKADFEAAVTCSDSDYSLYLDIYYRLSEFGMKEQAENYLKRAQELAGNEDEDYLARGEAYFLDGAYEDAIQSFAQVQNTDKGGQLYLSMASCYVALEDYEKATDCYDRYISCYGDDYRVLNELAVCQSESGLYEDAIATLQSAMALQGGMDEPSLKWNLILAYEGNHQMELAYATAVEYVGNYPTDTEGIQELEYLKEELNITE